MNDWRGTEIKVGSHIVYPQRQSSSMWMTEAEVLELKPHTVMVYEGVQGGYKQVPKEVIRLVVRPISTNPENWAPPLPKKTSTIERVDRVTVV